MRRASSLLFAMFICPALNLLGGRAGPQDPPSVPRHCVHKKGCNGLHIPSRDSRKRPSLITDAEVQTSALLSTPRMRARRALLERLDAHLEDLRELRVAEAQGSAAEPARAAGTSRGINATAGAIA